MPASRGYSSERLELTARMRDVLAAASLGASVRETAGELHVSEQTVRTIRAAACARLEARNVVHAITVARDRGEL
jgi:DNA-binding NarL/FixJ family response regulator